MSNDDRRRLQGSRLAAARIAAGFKSAREAAMSLEWVESTYRSHENGTRTIGPDDAERYARAFRAKGANTDASKILFGGLLAPSDDERDDPAPTVSPVQLVVANPQPPADQLIFASYGGKVEAGSWREVDDLDFETAKPPRAEKADRDFPQAPMFFIDVAGDSMNALKPRPILEGDQIVVLDFEGLGGRVVPRDGMVVVVEQTTEGGSMRERSVKQIEMHRDRTEFCPRSTNPKHKPIVVPYDTAFGEEDSDGRMVRIVGWVRRISNDVPGW